MSNQIPENPPPDSSPQHDPEWRNPFEPRPGDPPAPGYQPVIVHRQAPRRRFIELPRSLPIFTYALLGMIGLVFVISAGLDFVYGGFNNPIFIWGAKINVAIIAGEYWRLVTPIFLHAGLMHVGFNGYALFILGREIEALFGHMRFVFIFFAAGIAGVIASFALTPAPSVGASGGIFGLIGALIVYLYRNRDLLGPMGRRQLYSALRLAGLNLLIGLAPGIDMWGHVGGLLGGAAVTWLVGPLFTPNPILDDSRPITVEDTNPYERWWWAVPLTATALVILTVAAMRVSPVG